MARKPKKYSDPHSNTNQNLIRRWFGDLEVIEAKADLIIQPADIDIKNAVPNDPRNCILSRCGQRMYGSTLILFLGTLAYIDLLCEDGVRRVHRFTYSRAIRNFIDDFDAGKPLPPKGFTLKAPSPSNTLDGARARKKRRREALLKGEAMPSRENNTSGPTKEPRVARLNTLRRHLAEGRNGKSMIHFRKKRAA